MDRPRLLANTHEPRASVSLRNRWSSSAAVYRGQVSPADRVIDTHATKRPCRRLCRKPEGGHREVRALPGQVPMERLGTHAPDGADTQL